MPISFAFFPHKVDYILREKCKGHRHNSKYGRMIHIILTHDIGIEYNQDMMILNSSLRFKLK